MLHNVVRDITTCLHCKINRFFCDNDSSHVAEGPSEYATDGLCAWIEKIIMSDKGQNKYPLLQ